MYLTYQNITIRNAEAGDAGQLAAWWNDGTIMAHAGFPNGIGEKTEDIADSLKSDTDGVSRRLMIELDGVPAGEMNYRNKGSGTAEIGIKICDFTKQNKGLGKIVLSMLISSLFSEMGYVKIILDTNLNNTRAQHVYEQLGFKKIKINKDSWKNQIGELQSSVDYEMYRKDFINYAI